MEGVHASCIKEDTLSGVQWVAFSKRTGPGCRRAAQPLEPNTHNFEARL